MSTSKNKIIIAAGTGFIGEGLINHFANNEIVVLTRHVKPNFKNVKYIYWDARSMGDWCTELESAKAVINLTGKSVNCRYNQKNKDEILASRIDSTKIIGQAINACKIPPQIWINAGSATIYRHSTDKQMSEVNGEYENDFSVQVCKAWEKTFNEIETMQTRKLFLRITIVLGKSGGVFKTLKTLTKIGLGGKHGDGKQFVSWIHEKDLCRSIEFLIQHEELSGTFNCAAPNPVLNNDFMKKLRKKLKIPFGLPQPTFILAMGTWLMRTEKELVLKSRNVIPERLTQSGFEFEFKTIDEAYEDLCVK